MKNKIDRKKVYEKCFGQCAYCGEKLKFKDMQVDHIISKRNLTDHKNLKVDLNHIDNLNPSCRSCNKFKDTFTLEQFRNNIEYQIQKFRNHHPTFRLAERYGVIKCNEGHKVKFLFELINEINNYK